MTNRLIKEHSPYLQQHKENPVDWYPYGDEAFEIAKKLDKPIFISIGYSTCHWCHVMARESFSDPETAEFMNEKYVNIKMDREEYPAIDKAYQEMFQILNRRGGGWPLSVWANPDGSPFFIGTYFPKKNSFGMNSFMNINNQIIEAWKTDRETLDSQATNLIRGLKSMGEYMFKDVGAITEEIYAVEVVALQKRFDGKFGGIGGAPKFPRVSAFRFMLQEGTAKNIDDLISFTRFTYHKMAKGGIYDQLGGGFARYSVDARWLVPHFEKMLYDNAGLVHLGAELFALTKDPFVEWVVKDTIHWLEREMQNKEGGFYSALNADSEGREGAFFVWQKEELENALGDLYKIAELRYGITKKGNFEDPHHKEIKGMNVISIVKNMAEIMEELNLDEDDLFSKLNTIRQELFELRHEREKPSTDTKIIVSWNAMMIRSLFVAAELLNDGEISKLAEKNLKFLIDNQIKQQVLLRTFIPQNTGDKINREIEGVLDDYSFMIAALIQAFEYTDNWEYIKIAEKLHLLADTKFYDEDTGVYFINSSSENNLLGRVVSVSDDSMSSGLGVMIENIFKLGKYLQNEEMISRGQKIAERIIIRANDYPGAMSTLLQSAVNYLRYPTEIVIVNDASEKLFHSYNQAYIANRLVYKWNEKNKDDGRPFWEVLEEREQFQSTVFICKGMTCSIPLTTTEMVMEELQRNDN